MKSEFDPYSFDYNSRWGNCLKPTPLASLDVKQFYQRWLKYITAKTL